MSGSTQPASIGLVEPEGLSRLVALLRERGYTVVGPRISNGSIIYDEIEAIDDLPIGRSDEQEAGTYRLTRRDDEALFGYVVGPHSWKKFLHPPNVRLWRSRREGSDLRIVPEENDSPRYALLGVRACEIEAIRIQDRVLVGDVFTDPFYRNRRERCLVIAVNCTQAGGTCFCVPMNAGPKVEGGYDLALTELLDSTRHEFLVRAGSDRGNEILSELSCRPARESDLRAADAATERAAAQMGRSLDTRGIRELLQESLENARWQEVAERCINCANCTMVCPTCFCTTVEDTTDLSGDNAERWRRWDSCFTVDFSYIHGGSVRPSAMSRYRQWMTHKLSTWHDQFGTSGCVGCGRCITWCPVGIDITEEARAIRASVLGDRHPGAKQEE
jgi:ferredoxin